MGSNRARSALVVVMFMLVVRVLPLVVVAADVSNIINTRDDNQARVTINLHAC